MSSLIYLFTVRLIIFINSIIKPMPLIFRDHSPGQAAAVSDRSLISTSSLSQFLVLERVPPPQFLEHSDHEPQGDHWWDAGHSSKLQKSITVEGPGHGEFSATSTWGCLNSGIRHILVLWVDPPPQLLLQLDHSSHSVHSGSLMQGSSLQDELSVLSPKSKTI